MNTKTFNIALCIGWTLVVLGVCLVSVPLGLVVGGALVLFITLLLAFRAGVVANKTEEG